MLYYISESLCKQVQNNDLLTINILSELLEAWKRNKCLIDASRNTFDIICSHDNLKGFIGPYRRKQGLSSFYQHISFFVQLSSPEETHAKVINGAAGRILHISSYQDIFFFSTNTLICENSHDYMFYRWLANHFQLADIKQTVALNTQGANGGGSQTEYECELADQSKKLALVIYDNDKKYPGGLLGQTARSIENKMASLNSKYLWPHQISVHEVENLIPIEVLVGLRNKGHKTFLKNMAINKTDTMFDTLFTFFDFKKGFSPSTLRAFKLNLDTSDFEKLKALLVKLGASSKNIDRALRCSWNKKINENVILGGWGEKLLQGSVEFVYSNSCVYTLAPYQENEVRLLLRDVWAIGCAQNRSVI